MFIIGNSGQNIEAPRFDSKRDDTNSLFLGKRMAPDEHSNLSDYVSSLLPISDRRKVLLLMTSRFWN